MHAECDKPPVLDSSCLSEHPKVDNPVQAGAQLLEFISKREPWPKVEAYLDDKVLGK